MKRALPSAVVFRLAIYRFLFPLILIFLLPSMIRRMVKRGNFRRNLGQRFGFFTAEFQSSLRGKKTVWLQSISVGETQVALKLAREWTLRKPDLQIVISVTTSTGFDLASRVAGKNLHVIYNPIDLAGIVRRTLNAVQPAALVLIEGTWPVLVVESWRRGIPVSLVARLSPRSARRFRKFRGFSGPIFALLDHVFVQEPEEKITWETLGARVGAIHCCGAIKYDEPPAPIKKRAEFQSILETLGATESSSILLAGSTFPGEELILARTYLKLRESFPDLFLILVPRHVERTPEILLELASLPLEVARRTGPKKADVLLVDTTGELRDWYAFATVVFIGKSLASTGGQNPVEPALLGKPVVFGPHMENFAPIVRQWLATDAALQVADESELAIQVERLLGNSELRQSFAAKAIASISAHFGATRRVVERLRSSP
ncbi:MAG: glycosyltransferase N-terminal domain-containing protein [Chthoniobacterales bacterium]